MEQGRQLSQGSDLLSPDSPLFFGRTATMPVSAVSFKGMFLEWKAVNGGLNGLLIGDCDRLYNKLRKAVPNLDLYTAQYFLENTVTAMR